MSEVPTPATDRSVHAFSRSTALSVLPELQGGRKELPTLPQEQVDHRVLELPKETGSAFASPATRMRALRSMRMAALAPMRSGTSDTAPRDQPVRATTTKIRPRSCGRRGAAARNDSGRRSESRSTEKRSSSGTAGSAGFAESRSTQAMRPSITSSRSPSVEQMSHRMCAWRIRSATAGAATASGIQEHGSYAKHPPAPTDQRLYTPPPRHPEPSQSAASPVSPGGQEKERQWTAEATEFLSLPGH